MTFLSRIRINPLRAESRKLLANPRVMHGMVLGGVADRPLDERVLWRLDTDNVHRPQLYVLSRSKPDWTHAVETAGWPDADGDHAVVRDYTSLLAQVAVGRRFAFRVTANPVQNTRNPQKPSAGQEGSGAGDRARSYRLGHRTAAAQSRWFFERTERWGFEVPLSRTDEPVAGLEPSAVGGESPPPREARITDRRRVSFRKGPGKPVVLHTATFEGVLRVTDSAAFTERLMDGIGPGKAYGCGLITLAPLSGLPAGA